LHSLAVATVAVEDAQGAIDADAEEHEFVTSTISPRGAAFQREAEEGTEDFARETFAR